MKQLHQSKKAIALLILLFSVTGITAQYAIQKDPAVAADAMKRKLVVEMLEPSKKEKKKSTKDGNLNELIESYKLRNERLMTFFKDYWTLSSDISTVSSTQLDSLRKIKSTEYMFATCASVRDMKSEKNYGMKQTRMYYYNSFYLGLTDRKLLSLGAVASRGRVMNDLEYIFAINTLQYFLVQISSGTERGDLEESINRNSPSIKTKTLLVPDYLSEMTQAEMQEVYPYKISIASTEEIIAAIKRKDANYAYINLTHDAGSCGAKFHQFISDCSNGMPLLLDKKSNINITDNTVDSYAEHLIKKEVRQRAKLIRPRNLEKYMRIIEENSATPKK